MKHLLILLCLVLVLPGCTDEVEEFIPFDVAQQTKEGIAKNTRPGWSVICVNTSFIEVEDNKKYTGINQCTVSGPNGEEGMKIQQVYEVVRDGDHYIFEATSATEM